MLLSIISKRVNLNNKSFFLLLVIIFTQRVNAQNIAYAKQIIDTLTSANFDGRGVVNDGEKRAAQFIEKEFTRLNLQPITQKFIQPFNYPINTFPNLTTVFIDKNKLTPGVDFLVVPKSCKMEGSFNLIWYNKENIPTKKQFKKLINERFFENKFVVIDDLDVEGKETEFELLKSNGVGAAGIILLENEKLTHSLSTKLDDYVTLKIMRNSLKKQAKISSIHLDQQFLPNYQSQNVIGKIEGSKYPNSVIVFSAHYDHLGRMGKDVYFPGANDNASGVAMLLNLAEHYSKNKPEKTIVFMAFGAEESGLIGSKFYTENPMFPLKQINFLINLDLMGTGDEGIQVVNGSVYQSHFDKLVEINNTKNYLKDIKIRGKAANSDHYWFSEKGVPAVFIYTLGGIKAYHDIDDKAETLPLTEFEDCFRLITDFVNDL